MRANGKVGQRMDETDMTEWTRNARQSDRTWDVDE